LPSILERHRERFCADPGDDRAFSALEESLFVAGEWPELAGLYEHRLNAPSLAEDAPGRAQLQLRLAEIHHDRLEDRVQAAACYRAAITADPTCRVALTRLRELATAQGQWDVALQIAEVEVELDMGAAERAALLAQVGGLWLDHLRDGEQALIHFTRALEYDRVHPAALRGAARSAQLCRQPQQAAEIWQRLAECSEGETRTRALASWAGLEAAAGRTERASDLYRRVLSSEPLDPDALDALSAIAEAQQQWGLLADLHERRFEAAHDPERRAAVALAAGHVHLDHLGDAESARAWLQRAADLDAGDPRPYRMLADIERERSDEAGLLHALEGLVGCSGDRVAPSALLELAGLHAEQGDEEKALPLLQRAFARAPDDALVVEALSDSLAGLGRWDELADCLEHRAALAASDPSTCAAVLSELGVIQEDCLRDADAARQSYERAMQADPSHADLARRLERIYRKAESWTPLRALLEHTGRSGPRVKRPEQLCALAELLLEHFDDGDAATRAFESALALDESCRRAHRGRQKLAEQAGDVEAILVAYENEASVTTDSGRLGFLVRELARMYAGRGEPETALGWARRWITTAPEDPDALRLGARLLEELGESDELLALLERLNPLLPSGEQAANRRRLGALHEAADRADAAIEAYRDALEADPADVDALHRLVALFERSGAHPEELARTHQTRSELIDGPERAACLDALAKLLEDRLGDPVRAIDALRRLADTEGAPSDVEERIEALLERTGRFEELADRLRIRISAAGGSERRALELRRAGTLLEHLSLFDEAVQAFRDLCEGDPTCSEAERGLERALRAGGDTAGLAELLGQQAATHPDATMRERAALERAGILEQDPAQQAEAVEIFRGLVEDAEDVEHRDRAARRLTALLERMGDWSGLRAHLESQLSVDPADNRNEPHEPDRDEPHEPDHAKLHERIAGLCRDRLGDEAAAVEHLEAAYALDPERADLLQTLARLHDEAGRHAELAEVLEAEIRALDDPAAELPLRCRVAHLCIHALEDRQRARGHYERILALDPSDGDAAEFLVGCLDGEHRHDEMARVLEGRLNALDGSAKDPDGDAAPERTSLRLRIAGLRGSSLDDVDGAIAILEPAIGEVGPVAAIAEPLAGFYERAGYATDLIDLCRRAAEHCEAGPERGTWHSRRADTLRSNGDAPGAVEAYRAALTDRPNDADAKAALRELHRGLGQAAPLAQLLASELEVLTGPAEIPVRLELARLLMGPLGQREAALLHLRRVVQLEPDHAEALDKGLALADHLDRPDVIRDLLDDALARPQPPSVRARHLTQRGRLLASNAGDADAAQEAVCDYREALALDSSRNDVRDALRQLLEATGQWEAALDCLFQEACHAEPEARAELWAEGAEQAWVHLSPEHALPWLERVRRERPRDAALLARIADAHRIAGRPRARLRALEEQLAVCADALSRRDLEIECARVLERELDAPGRAAAALERARELCAEDIETLHHLDRLYRELGCHRERARIVAAMVELSHPHERVSLLCEAAVIHRELAEHREAVALLLRAVDSTPKTSAMYAELLRTLGEALSDGAPPEVQARCAEAELAALEGGGPVFVERRLELRRGLARTYLGSGRRDDALRHLRPLIDESPDDFDPTGSLEASLLDGLRAQSAWVELERRLAARLERLPEDPAGWLELARLREERLASSRPAADAYRRVVEFDATSLPGLHGLRAASERIGDWPEVVRTLEVELEHPAFTAPEQRSSLLRRLGDVAAQRLHSTTRASRAYAAAIEANPENFHAHRALELLLESMEDWRGALDLYESEVEVLGEREPERRQRAWLRAGKIARDHTGEPQRAAAAYAEAAHLGPLPIERRAEQAELCAQSGDITAFADVFADWCDDPDAEVTSHDQLRLARALLDLGQLDAALERAERATAADADNGHAWDLVARLEEEHGDPARAAEAFDRAAALSQEAGASDRLVKAALLLEAEAPAEAAERLMRAAALDPAALDPQIALARICAALERWTEAEGAATHALERAAEAEAPEAVQLETALIGGRAARARSHTENAAHFYERALELAPDHPEALAGAGETLHALGEYPAAAAMLERCLSEQTENSDAALHHALLARCLAALDRPEEALEHCESALERDPSEQDAHALRVELHQQAGRVDEGIAALEHWAEHASPTQRAQRLLRLAEWELSLGDREGAAEDHLKQAVDADPALASGWERLTKLLWENDRCEEALEVATMGLESDSTPQARAALALFQARALERQGDRAAAAKALGFVVDADPRSSEAAMAQARLLRASGDWSGAAEALEIFARRHPGDDPAAVADALHQLGRLRAGPLEDPEGAIEAYRHAVELEPDRVELRAALADLLSHRPDCWEEALEQHGTALALCPTHPPSLHAVLRIAGDRGSDAAIADGACLLAALGLSSASDAAIAPERPSFRIAGEARMRDDLHEALRDAVARNEREIGAALGVSPAAPEPSGAMDPVTAFRASALEAEAKLAARALLPLSDEEVGELLTCAATLALEPDGVDASGATLNALASALGRRARRRIKKALGETTVTDVQAIDFGAWRSELRAMAATQAVDDAGCTLRAAFVALACSAEEGAASEVAADADLTTLVAECPVAQELLRRCIARWLPEIRA
jgi:tetratricopeptide (TPR) repeat protein